MMVMKIASSIQARSLQYRQEKYISLLKYSSAKYRATIKTFHLSSSAQKTLEMYNRLSFNNLKRGIKNETICCELALNNKKN